jgi:hypothetical protein
LTEPVIAEQLVVMVKIEVVVPRILILPVGTGRA